MTAEYASRRPIVDGDYLSARDRVLVLAVHPDDESLCAGGLIQHALAHGAKVRVVFITDGDNNPWPQRFVEGVGAFILPIARDGAKGGAERLSMRSPASVCLVEMRNSGDSLTSV